MTPYKIIKRGTEARDALLRGANFFADCVKDTLGPFGQNFLLEKDNKVTNDGATVASELEMKDEIEQRGLTHLRQATLEANQILGDGSTTATILAQAIMKASIKRLGNDKTAKGKMRPSELIIQIEKERKDITEKLVAMATPVETEEDLIHSARVSVGDEELGSLIGQAQWKLGSEGVLMAEDTNALFSSVEYVNGLLLDNGFGTSLVITDQKNECLSVKDTYVLLTNYTFGTPDGLVPILPTMKIIANNLNAKNLIIVARAFGEQAIKHCMENIKTGFNVYPVNAPYTNQAEIMKDLAAVLGGRFVSTEDSELEDLQISDFGFSTDFVAKRFSATVAGVKDEQSRARIEKRIDELRKAFDGAESAFEKKNLETRIAQLSAGFGIVKIGAHSQSEQKYKKDKADDAVNAVRAAFQEGTVPGAGLAFKQIAEKMPDTAILKIPLMSIYEQIMVSAPEGFIVEEWVRDPVKVLRVALEKACSVAGRLATAGGATATERPRSRYVEEIPKEE